MNIAVITGASSGMGRQFVLQLDAAQQYDEIWVIARRRERLEELRTRAPLRILCMDLTQQGSYEEYRGLLEQEKPNVVTLVNAAGYGKFEPAEQIDLADAMGIIDLNCKALVAFCQLTLPYMTKGAQIYNIGSLSSFQPVPLMISYASSKALVLSYSRGLGRELRDRGIRVICVCPGWVTTEFFDRAMSRNKTAVNYFNSLWTPEDVVKKAIRDAKRGKDVSVLGASVRLQVLGVKLLPHRLVMDVWMKQQSGGKKGKKLPGT